MTILEQAPPVIQPEHDDLPAETVDLSGIQERHPDWPKLNLSFYFAPHITKEDMEGIAPHLEKADVFLYEDVSRSEKARRFFNDEMQNPTRSLDEILDEKHGYYPRKLTQDEPIIRGLYGQNKAASSIDIGKTSDERLMAERVMYYLSQEPPHSAVYEEALSILGNRYREVARLQNEREAMMVANFEEEMEQILGERPDLMKRDDLNILVQMGSTHTTLRHKFASHGLKSDRAFSSSPDYIYSYTDELVRTYMYGKQPRNDLLMRATSEEILRERIARSTRSNDKLFTYLRAVVGDLTHDEMELLYGYWNDGTLTEPIVDELLKSHGHDGLPNDEQDMDKVTAKFHRHKHALAQAAIVKSE